MHRAAAADRRGAIHRARRMGWITPREDRPPADFVAQLDELSPLEQDTLELVAFAEPLHEAALLQLLDTETVTKLLNKQVLVVRTDASGVRSTTSPSRSRRTVVRPSSAAIVASQ